MRKIKESNVFVSKVNVFDLEEIEFLYEMLGERTADQSISHKEMPTFIDHKKFVESMPYEFWGIIFCLVDRKNFAMVGNIYLTKNNEIGVFVRKRWHGKGLGEVAIRKVIDSNVNLFPIYANINPKNHVSIDFFEKKFNAKHIQNTYLIEK